MGASESVRTRGWRDVRPQTRWCKGCALELDRSEFTRVLDHKRKAIYMRPTCKVCERPGKAEHVRKMRGTQPVTYVSCVPVAIALRELIEHYGTRTAAAKACHTCRSTVRQVLDHGQAQIKSDTATRIIRHALEIRGLA